MLLICTSFTILSLIAIESFNPVASDLSFRNFLKNLQIKQVQSAFPDLRCALDQ